MTLITILGPTAVGKTKLAVALAHRIGGEIISADSRQVYQGMDIGTGKDLKDFEYQERSIPYHLIDIRKAGETYDVFNFQQDFYSIYTKIKANGKPAILCGGSGLYLQAALDDFAMLKVPVNKSLRNKLVPLSQDELNHFLLSIQPNTHNTTDLEDSERTIRAIEIASFDKEHSETRRKSPVGKHFVFGLTLDREKLRSRILERMEARFEEGMIEEVIQLKKEGISDEQLDYYGLEYRFINLYLKGEMSLEEMKEKLVQAIRRFAKKQMTWYRRMEKKGREIYWLNAEDSMEQNLSVIEKKLALK